MQRQLTSATDADCDDNDDDVAIDEDDGDSVDAPHAVDSGA